MPSPNDESTLTIVFAAARGGDSAALTQLMERYRPYLLKVANDELDSGLRVKCGASDLVQEALLEGHKEFVRFLGHSESELLTWLRHILRNNLIDQARKFRHASARDINKERPIDDENGLDFLTSALTPIEALLKLEKEATLELCLERLPEEDRLAIRMRHLEGKSFAEIGAALGKSADTARKAWFRALNKLRQELKSHGNFGSSYFGPSS